MPGPSVGPGAPQMKFDDFFKGIQDVGFKAVNNLANRATLGDETARRIALAEERDDYAGLNGSGPYDRSGALNDAASGDPWYRNPLGSPAGQVIKGALPMILIAVVVIAAFAYFRKRA